MILGHNSIIVILGANLLLNSNDIKLCENLFKNANMLVTNLELPLSNFFYFLIIQNNSNLFYNNSLFFKIYYSLYRNCYYFIKVG